MYMATVRLGGAPRGPQPPSADAAGRPRPSPAGDAEKSAAGYG